MTTLYFRYPEGMLPVQLLRRAFFAAGLGKVPLRSEIMLTGDILSATTDATGSCTFFFPWLNKRLGVIFLSTDTLCERERPYLLVKELARGQLGRIIRRFVQLVYFGFKPPLKLRKMIQYEVSELAKIATSNEEDPQTQEAATEQLERLINLCHYLLDSFIDQSLAFRQRVATRFPVRLGINTDHFFAENPVEHFHAYTDHLKEVFHLVNPTPSWRELEPEPDRYRWDILEKRIAVTRERGFVAVGGPIIEFDQRSIPDWLCERIEEQGALEKFTLKYLDTFLEHFANQVDIWILASRINTPQLRACSPDRIMNLVKKISWVFENHELHQPGLVAVDQPWGDYLLHHDSPYSPMNIAEILGALPGLDGIMLDLNVGFSKRSSLPRDTMALSMMIDQWSSFTKPLYLSLGIPSELGTDPEIPEEFINFSFNWSKKTQQEWIHRYLPVLFCKRSIDGIFWNLLEDNESHDFVSTGLFDNVGRLKPAYRKLAAIRKAYID